jgi:hypothetical protein
MMMMMMMMMMMTAFASAPAPHLTRVRRRDYEGGHGTHVVGSILGSAMPTNFPGFENGEEEVKDEK